MDPGKRWWWIAYTDETRAKGERAVGACVVQAGGGFADAARLALDRGLQPVGETIEALGGMVHFEHGDPPRSYVNRYLTNEEATELGGLWTGGIASREDIAQAFADDTAQIGESLFRGRK